VGLVSARGLVEHDQVLLHHGAHLVDDLLPVLLHPHCRRVPEQKWTNENPWSEREPTNGNISCCLCCGTRTVAEYLRNTARTNENPLIEWQPTNRNISCCLRQCHEINKYFLKVLKIKSVLSVLTPMVFNFFLHPNCSEKYLLNSCLLL
jgi:hypothetical protein